MASIKNKNKLFKHQILITSVLVFAIVVSMFGGSYALFSSTSKADEYNVLKVGNLEISYVDVGDGYSDVLSLNGAYPISDSEGSNSTPYRFSITNTGSITADFKIKILYDESVIEEDGCSDKTLEQKYVKYKLDSNDPQLLNSKENEDYLVYETTDLLAGSSEIHEIRLWIDSNASNEVLGKHFHGKVVVETTQSGVTKSTELVIGDSITLNDGSKWHVLENSSMNNTTVKLLSDYNLNSDGTYNTTCDSKTCSPQVFDDANNRLEENNSYCNLADKGCNMYEANGSSVIKDSTVKTWLEEVYLPILKSTLTNNEDLTVSLPTMEELAKADGQVFNQSQITFTSSWLTTTSYWTKTQSNINSSYVWGVVGDYNNSYVNYANNNTSFGIRPVIVVSKENIN